MYQKSIRSLPHNYKPHDKFMVENAQMSRGEEHIDHASLMEDYLTHTMQNQNVIEPKTTEDQQMKPYGSNTILNTRVHGERHDYRPMYGAERDFNDYFEDSRKSHGQFNYNVTDKMAKQRIKENYDNRVGQLEQSLPSSKMHNYLYAKNLLVERKRARKKLVINHDIREMEAKATNILTGSTPAFAKGYVDMLKRKDLEEKNTRKSNLSRDYNMTHYRVVPTFDIEETMLPIKVNVSLTAEQKSLFARILKDNLVMKDFTPVQVRKGIANIDKLLSSIPLMKQEFSALVRFKDFLMNETQRSLGRTHQNNVKTMQVFQYRFQKHIAAIATRRKLPTCSQVSIESLVAKNLHLVRQFVDIDIRTHITHPDPTIHRQNVVSQIRLQKQLEGIIKRTPQFKGLKVADVISDVKRAVINREQTTNKYKILTKSGTMATNKQVQRMKVNLDHNRHYKHVRGAARTTKGVSRGAIQDSRSRTPLADREIGVRAIDQYF